MIWKAVNFQLFILIFMVKLAYLMQSEIDFHRFHILILQIQRFFFICM